MSEMLKQVVESGGLLTLITVFVALPYLYLSLAAEVHKDCLEFRKLQASCIEQGLDADEAKRVDLASRRIDSNSGVFDTDWWVLAALAVRRNPTRAGKLATAGLLLNGLSLVIPILVLVLAVGRLLISAGGVTNR